MEKKGRLERGEGINLSLCLKQIQIYGSKKTGFRNKSPQKAAIAL